MKTVVITGSTRGIGFGLGDAFLSRGCQVVINGRSQDSADRAVDQLASRHAKDDILGVGGDVSNLEQLQALWNAAVEHFGKVDIWINNAGFANERVNFWQLSPEDIEALIRTNLIGAMQGSRIAMLGMLKQGYGAIYNMEGYGSNGRRSVHGLTLYGTSKAGLRFFDQCLMEEASQTSILVGSLSPGMVVTDLLERRNESPEEWERNKRIFNILADRVETVSPWLADKILENDQNGAQISYLNNLKIMGRFVQSLFKNRDLFSEQS